MERVWAEVGEVNRTRLHETGLHVDLLEMGGSAARVGSTVEMSSKVGDGGPQRKTDRLEEWVGEVFEGAPEDEKVRGGRS